MDQVTGSVILMNQNTLFLLFLLLLILKNRRVIRRRWWVHPINGFRPFQGAGENLYRELLHLNDEESFFNFTRLNFTQFDELLDLISPLIRKQRTRDDVIDPESRLLITLR